MDSWYVSTISGVDKGENVRTPVSFRGHLRLDHRPDEVSRRPTPICRPSAAVIPGAILYERELQDMFGIVVENLPDPRPMLMSDDWPAGNFPLRKDWKFDRPAEVIPGGKK